MEKKVYILGGAQTDFERNWTKEGKNMIALLKEAVEDGFKDAGFTYDEMVSLNKENRVAAFVGNFIAEQYISQGHLGAFLTEVNPAFYGVPSARYEAACASSSVALDAAITKIEAGEYDVCIVVGWEIMKSVDSKKGGDILGRAAYYEKEGKGIDLPFPKLFGRLADATIEKYGLDKERYLNALAKISCINYGNAKRNPLAQTRKWFMSYEEASTRGTESNPNVGGLLGVSDCSQVTDGAAVVILCSEKYAQEKGMEDLAFVKGYGHRTAPLLFDKKIADNANSEYVLPWTRQACLDAYKRAGLSVDANAQCMALGAFREHLQACMDTGSLDLDGTQRVHDPIAFNNRIAHHGSALVPKLADHVVLPCAPHAHRASPAQLVKLCESQARESTP